MSSPRPQPDGPVAGDASSLGPEPTLVRATASGPDAMARLMADRAWCWTGFIVMIVLGTWAFAPSLPGTWVWDDHSEIIDNPLIKEPAGWRKIWLGATGTFDYFPIKSTLQWLQWQLWGDNPFPYRVTNIALHLLSALLVWRLLRKLGCAPLAAWLGGTLFAVHPLTVESVAWIAEFKNTVSLPPLLLAAIAFVDFTEHGRRRDYALTLVWFVVAGLSKTSVVMLPPWLLVFLWWRRGAVTTRDLKTLAPLFGISAALGAVTVWFQQVRAIGPWEIVTGSMLERIGRAGAAIWFYLAKAIVPVGLLPVYPRSVPFESTLARTLAWAALIALLGWSWRRREGWGRHVILGGGWFVFHLVPVLGLVAMAFLNFAWVADHFAYLSLIGVIGLAVAAWARAWRQWPSIRTGLAAATLMIVVLSVVASRRHAARFQSEETLWRYTLAHNPSAWVGHHNLAVALAYQKRFAEAVEHTTKAQQLKPDYGDVQLNAANYLAQLGRVEEALAAAAAAERLGAATAAMRANVGGALLRAGRVPAALAQYQRALQLEPADPKLHKDFGVALFLAGNPAAAVEHYERGLALAPDPETHANCSVALMALNRLPEALRHCDEAVRLAPEMVDGHYNRGIILARLGELAAAQAEFAQTLRLNPRHAEAYYNLGDALRRQGRTAEAAAAFHAALRIRPGLEAARAGLEQLEPAGPKP